MKVRIGWAGKTFLKAVVGSLIDGTISAEITPNHGSISITPYSDRYGGPFLGVGRVDFTGLSPQTRYTYTIRSGNELPITGKFITAPATTNTRCAFILSTCDSNTARTRHRPFKYIRALQEFYTASDTPFAMLHIDDVNYVDTNIVVTAGFPTQPLATQSMCESKYYALGWAQWLGLLQDNTKWSGDADRQWCYQNVPAHMTVGDHGFAGNFRRGPSVAGGTDYWVDDIAADGKSWTAAQIEAAALPEVRKWISDIGAPIYRAGELYSGLEFGSLRAFCTDMEMHCTPWDGSSTANPCYGAQQIADFFEWMDVSSHPFKLMTHESGVSQAGQAWYERYTTEADAWKSTYLPKTNLNGSSGQLFHAYGDNHHRHVIEFTDPVFWAFSSGVLQDSQSVGQNLHKKIFGWGGVYRWGDGAIKSTGDNPIAGFWLFDLFPSTASSAERIEARYINGSNGLTIYGPVQMVAGQGDNKWSAVNKHKIG